MNDHEPSSPETRDKQIDNPDAEAEQLSLDNEAAVNQQLAFPDVTGKRSKEEELRVARQGMAKARRDLGAAYKRREESRQESADQ